MNRFEKWFLIGAAAATLATEGALSQPKQDEVAPADDTTKSSTVWNDGQSLSREEAVGFIMNGKTYTPDQLQALKSILGDSPVAENKESEGPGSKKNSSTLGAPTLYFNTKMGNNSLLGEYGMGLFSNDKLELGVSRHINAGDYGNYLKFNDSPVLRGVLAVNFRGNYAIEDAIGRSTISIGAKYHSLLSGDSQYQREAELFSKLAMGRDGRADIIGLRIISDGSDVSKIMEIGGFYGQSRPNLNAGIGIDMKLKQGVSRIYGGVDYLATRSLLLSGVIEKNFPVEGQLSSEEITFKVTYAGKTYALGGQAGFEHVTQAMPMWKDAGANGNNLHAELFFAQKLGRGVVIEPFVAIDNFKPQPYGERPTSYGFGVKLRLDFSEQKKMYGSGQGHGSRDEKDYVHRDDAKVMREMAFTRSNEQLVCRPSGMASFRGTEFAKQAGSALYTIKR